MLVMFRPLEPDPRAELKYPRLGHRQDLVEFADGFAGYAPAPKLFCRVTTFW